MPLSREQASAYLARIRHGGDVSPTLPTLRALHRAHLLSVPFENLSISRGERIHLEEAWLFEKIVSRRRGGYCYELNGLFALLLESLGFEVSRLAARVGPDGIDFDHLVLRVSLGEPWLADVGFGDSFVKPLALRGRDPQDGDERRSYRLSESAGGLLLERLDDGAWARQFELGLQSWPLAAFELGNHFHQTSPESHFTQNTVVSLATETGRLTLSKHRLVTTENGVRREEALDGPAEADVLRQRFGIDER